MNDRHYSEIFNDFKLHHPYMVNDVDSFRPRGEMGIRITMQNGTRYDYDIVTRGVRMVKTFVANDIRDITDEYCRSALAYNLSERMAIKGYSQHTLAEDTGLSKGSIYNYLNQKATATSTALRRMARALDCTVDELLN